MMMMEQQHQTFGQPQLRGGRGKLEPTRSMPMGMTRLNHSHRQGSVSKDPTTHHHHPTSPTRRQPPQRTASGSRSTLMNPYQNFMQRAGSNRSLSPKRDTTNNSGSGGDGSSCCPTTPKHKDSSDNLQDMLFQYDIDDPKYHHANETECYPFRAEIGGTRRKGGGSKKYGILRSLCHALLLICLGFLLGAGYLYWNDGGNHNFIRISLGRASISLGGQPAEEAITLPAIDLDMPARIPLSDKLIQKMQRDKQMHQEEIRSLKQELVRLARKKEIHEQQQVERDSEKQQLRSSREKSTGDANGHQAMEQEQQQQQEGNHQVPEEQQQQQQQQRLRGGESPQNNNNNHDNDNNNKDKEIHLINRSDHLVQLYWISDKKVAGDQVEWVLISDPADPVGPGATFHFHARPNHHFALQSEDSEVEPLRFKISPGEADEYVIVDDNWELLLETGGDGSWHIQQQAGDDESHDSNNNNNNNGDTAEAQQQQ